MHHVHIQIKIRIPILVLLSPLGPPSLVCFALLLHNQLQNVWEYMRISTFLFFKCTIFSLHVSWENLNLIDWNRENLNLIDWNTTKQNVLFWAEIIEYILSSIIILNGLFHFSECTRADNKTLLTFEHQFVFFEIKSKKFTAFQTLSNSLFCVHWESQGITGLLWSLGKRPRILNT